MDLYAEKKLARIVGRGLWFLIRKTVWVYQCAIIAAYIAGVFWTFLALNAMGVSTQSKIVYSLAWPSLQIQAMGRVYKIHTKANEQREAVVNRILGE